MEVDIVKYIPFGRENAIGRAELAMKVGCSDRTMRDLINTARKREVIVNIQNGSGYYRLLKMMWEKLKNSSGRKKTGQKIFSAVCNLSESS
jgi:hypothetical protein